MYHGSGLSIKKAGETSGQIMNKDYHLLAAYLNGTANAEERQRVELWIQQNPQNQQEFENFKRIWDEVGELRPDQTVNTGESWQRFRELRKAKANQPRFVQLRSWMTRAAAVLLICTVSYWIWDFQQRPTDHILVENVEQQSDIILPDGTKVWLNKHSQLSYPKEFSSAERRVMLSGEAYFEVVRDTEKPFLINGDNTEVRVLGTSFNVHTTEAQTEVIVNSGKVAFYEQDNPEAQISLQAGDKGIYHSVDSRLVKTKNLDNNYLSWKTGQLILRNSTLEEALEAINRHYGVQVTLENPVMAQCRITTRFDDQPLQEVIEEINLLLGATFDQTTNGYVLKGDKCP